MATKAVDWRHHLIRSEIARSRAFGDYLAQLRGREFSSALPRDLIDFIVAVNDGIMSRLDGLLTDEEFSELPEAAAETHLVRHSVLYLYLYQITSILEYVEASRTIIEFTAPLQRLVAPKDRRLRILLHALPEVNYSWEDLVGRLTELAGRLEIPISVSPPAPAVWAIGFPGLQPGQTLTHSLLAHELGHGIVQPQSFVISLRRKARIDSDALGRFIADTYQPHLPRQLRQLVRSSLRRTLDAILLEWLEEIACDVIGYEIMGPAFLFSSVYFLPSLAPLDQCTEKYPPVRLRINLLYRLLKADLDLPPGQVPKDYKGWFGAEASDFLLEWDRRVSASGTYPPLDDLAVNAVNAGFNEVCALVRGRMAPVPRYKFSDHREAVDQLVKRVALCVPPNELDDPSGVPADPACILNAGWISYFSLVDSLSREHGWNEWETRARIEDWTAKALELQEVLRRWREVYPVKENDQ